MRAYLTGGLKLGGLRVALGALFGVMAVGTFFVQQRRGSSAEQAGCGLCAAGCLLA